MLNKLIQTRKPLHHDALPFVLMWSQKSGCTAILRWFLYHANELSIAEQYQSESAGLDIHDYERNVLKKRTDYDKDLVKKLAADTSSIQFLRCPYARAFSSYMHIQSRFFIRLTQEGRTTPGMEVRKDIFASGTAAMSALSTLFHSWTTCSGYTNRISTASKSITGHKSPQYTLP